jgi:NAD(P)H-quinone oxidoreductase subunit 6
VPITEAVFYLLATFTVVCALGVALSNNIMYSAFSLMGTLLGVAATYVGGILVLTIFAVMLTHRIADVHVSNRAVGRPIAVVLVGAVLWWMIRVGTAASWVTKDAAAPVPTTYGVGNAFLTDYLLPYEIASLVLLVALIGAVVVSRKEIT